MRVQTPDVTLKNFPSTKLLQSLSRVQISSSISNFQFGFKLILGSWYNMKKIIVLLGLISRYFCPCFVFFRFFFFFFFRDHAKVQISKLEIRAIRKIVTLEMKLFSERKRWQVLFVREREIQTDRQTDRQTDTEREGD